MAHVLAVDLGGTKCSAAVIDRKGQVVSQLTASVDTSGPRAPVLQIVQLAKTLAGAKTAKDAFVAASVAVPGLVRPTGTVWAPNLPGWKQLPLARLLRRSLGIPVLVESDRNAAVLGEAWRGAARGKSDVIVLMIGTGIGAGILSGGRIVRGAHELSGCAGWLTVTREEVPSAAARGELESLVAGPAIARAAQARLRAGESSSLAGFAAASITANDVATAARRGDPVARDILVRSGRYLGFAIANLISLFDPQIVVVGGGLAAASDLFLAPARRAMAERAQPLAAARVKIAVSRLGNKANLLGCAHLAWKAARS